MNNLYKLDSKGRLRVWRVDYTENSYTVQHGLVDGKKVSSTVNVYQGKNIGRANATTIAEQTKLDAEALWTKQRDRKGYTEKIPTEKPLMPMLAHRFDKYSHKLVYPCYLQPKLDGMRCIAHIKGGVVNLLSRQNSEITTVPHIVEQLSKLDDGIYDGELYNHDMLFQELISLLKADKELKDTSEVEYHIYDMIFEQPYSDRLQTINNQLYILNLPNVIPVMTVSVEDEYELIQLHEDFIKEGYEGSIARNVKSKYKVNGRSYDLLKVKDFMEAEFKIIDVVNGKGDFEDKGIFVCETEGATFNVTPKGDAAYRQSVLENKDSLIGKYLTVEFFEYTTSDNPVPRFPVGKAVRDYE